MENPYLIIAVSGEVEKALAVHENASQIGIMLNQLMTTAEYTTNEIRTAAVHMISQANNADLHKNK